MFFIMDMFNEGLFKDIVLLNIIIGMDIKDICGSVDYVVCELLNFLFICNVYV